jgi:hypothetical protein
MVGGHVGDRVTLRCRKRLALLRRGLRIGNGPKLPGVRNLSARAAKPATKIRFRCIRPPSCAGSTAGHIARRAMRRPAGAAWSGASEITRESIADTILGKDEMRRHGVGLWPISSGFR